MVWDWMPGGRRRAERLDMLGEPLVLPRVLALVFVLVLSCSRSET